MQFFTDLFETVHEFSSQYEDVHVFGHHCRIYFLNYLKLWDMPD